MSIVTITLDAQPGVAASAAAHDLAADTGAGEVTPYDDQENEVPAMIDTLGDGMPCPEAGGVSADMVQGAQGAPAQQPEESDELSEIAQLNEFEFGSVFPDARVIMGQYPAETAGSCEDIASHAMVSESTAGGAGNAPEQPASGMQSNGARAEANNDADDDPHFDARICDICKVPNSPESFLLCDECNRGYHTHCLQPALPSVPDGDWVCPPCSDRFFKLNGSSDDYLAWLDRHSLVAVLGKSGTHRPEHGRPMGGIFILPNPVQFNTFRGCAVLHRQELVAREHRVAAREALEEEITFDVCVRTPYVFEYTDGSWHLMSADEASALLPGNPLLQLEVPQGPAPVIQLDAGHSLFETNFPQGSWGEILQKAGAFKFLASKVLNGELYELRDYPMPTSSPPPALHGEMRDALDIIARLCTTFREESTKRLTLRIQCR